MPNIKKSNETGRFVSHAKKVERRCENCAKVFLIKESSLKYGRGRCCSRKCVDQNKKTTYLKENNPMYGTGMSKEEKKHREMIRSLLNSARHRARNKGIECNITADDIVVPDVCPFLGIPLFRGEGKSCDNSPTLDRINPNLGYVKDNIHVISFRANSIKRDASLEEIMMIAEALKQLWQK